MASTGGTASNNPVQATQGGGGPAASPQKRRGCLSYLLRSMLGGLILIALYTVFMLWFSYSEGERAGVLQKFSKRGWICKTYEGELAMYVVGGVAPQIWSFSVRDEVTAGELAKAVGRQVRLHYAEHRGLPTNCFGETGYFVNRVEIVGPPLGLEQRPGDLTRPAEAGKPPQ